MSEQVRYKVTLEAKSDHKEFSRTVMVDENHLDRAYSVARMGIEREHDDRASERWSLVQIIRI